MLAASLTMLKAVGIDGSAIGLNTVRNWIICMRTLFKQRKKKTALEKNEK